MKNKTNPEYRQKKQTNGQPQLGIIESKRMAAVLLVILTAGALFAWWIGVRTNNEMRADLLNRARLVAQAVNVERVKSLSGTEADLVTPEYRGLKEQLAANRSVNPQCRFIYLMGRKPDGAVFIFVDSEPVGLKDYSPPGQVYAEAPEDIRRVFDAKAAVVEGPFHDRWGEWVSALVPLIDPQTGAVVTVLGMDIDAHTWKWDVASRAILPVGLMLVLIIAMATAFISARRVEGSAKPVLRRLMPPLAVTVILLMAGAGVLLWQQHQQRIAGEIKARIAEVSREMRMDIANQAGGLSMALRPIAADATVQKALREGNANRLLAAWWPVFEMLQSESNVTHFYFLDKNRVCLLRVHKPEKRGDLINRFTALEAERTGKTASGIELGPLGTFTLRAVQPVFEGGSLIGYVELGKEIEDILRGRLAPGLDVAVVIRKEHLNRQSWEDGMRMLGRAADWDRLPRSAVIFSSQGRLPDAFASWADNIAGDPDLGKTDREITFDGKDWRVSAAPLQDASGREVGNLLVMCGISAEKETFLRLLVLGGTAGAVLLAMLLGFIYVLLHRTDQGLLAQQAALRESEIRMRSITDSAHDAILMMDPEGRVSYWNMAAERILGYTNSEATGQDLHSLIAPPRYHEAHQAAFPAFRQTGQGAAVGKTLDLSARRKDGQEISVQLSLSAIQINGEWNAVGLLRDITERKRAEEELRETNRQLETATARANEMAVQAEMASIAKSEFLANMSHEIRTPMNAIIGMADLLWDSSLTTEQRQYVQIFRSAGENLLTLINDILDLSKVESGQLSLEYIPYDLFDILDKTCEVISLRAHSRNLELACRISPHVPQRIQGDPTRLRQVLTNILGNAVKFTEVGEIVLTVLPTEGEDSLKSPQYLQFSVRDTGIGIPADKLDAIFEKFTQSDSSITRKYEGTGLGLSISRRLVELMGGRIWVESRPGEGSTFFFTIPSEAAPPEENQETVFMPETGLKGLNILVVDDNVTNRLILRETLAQWGCLVTEAADGFEGLTALNKAKEEGTPFHVALLDSRMPGMDGFTLAEEIRSKPDLVALSIMMLTSENRSGDRRRAKALGMTEYLIKPVKRQALKDALLAALGRDEILCKPQAPLDKPLPEDRRHLRLLLVEDSEDNRFLVQAYLKKTSYLIDTAENGQIAVEKFLSDAYDLILMDMQMPVMDGYTATREIRRREREEGRERTPIIALTAHALKDDLQKSLDAGCDAHLTKPISKQVLLEAIQKFSVPGTVPGEMS
jgi:two-component system sensor histidine kinase/response regulator